MNWGDEITLIEYKKELDTLKSPYFIKKSESKVFCDLKSVKRSEYYQAQSVGYQVEKVFVIKQVDFNEKYNYVEFNGREYCILRTYKINASDIELICTGRNHEQNE